jgi:hypothetical protein
MPRVRLLVRMNIADGYHERGDEVDVPGDVASNLAHLDRAVIVRGEQPTTPERAARSEKSKRRRREVT